MLAELLHFVKQLKQILSQQFRKELSLEIEKLLLINDSTFFSYRCLGVLKESTTYSVVFFFVSVVADDLSLLCVSGH